MNRVRDVASKAITNVAGTKLEKKETIKAMLSCLIAIAKKELVVEEVTFPPAHRIFFKSLEPTTSEV